MFQFFARFTTLIVESIYERKTMSKQRSPLYIIILVIFNLIMIGVTGGWWFIAIALWFMFHLLNR